jgi:5-hydroxyisourate hydrolase
MSLSTHILDVSRGVPAAGVDVVLVHITGDGATELTRARTDADGRVAASFGGALAAGVYELRFDVAGYHKQTGTASFYDVIPVRFRILDAGEHYHVPLLLAPWGYSTYRGS